MKRAILIGVWIPVIILVEFINWTCLALDFLFFPRFKKVTIKPPHFIIGMPRSATTFCYALLLSDSRNISSMKLWEILLAPSIIQKKLILFIKQTDNHLNNIIYKTIYTIDHHFFKQIDSIHPISLFNNEEDDYLFVHVFASLSISFIFPESDRILSLRKFDENLTKRQKHFLMSYYRSCIKRHLYVFGKEKRYLAKSPSHTPKIRTLMEYFPDCRFIYLLRNPLDAIASTITLFQKFKEIFFLTLSKNEIIDLTLDLADSWYQYPLVSNKPLLNKAVFIVPFYQLVTHPYDSICGLYKKMNLEMSDSYCESLRQIVLDSVNFKSRNRYLPEEFGLSRETIDKRYSFVYQIYSECENSKSYNHDKQFSFKT